MQLRSMGLGSRVCLSALLAVLLAGCGVTVNKTPPAALTITTNSLAAATVNSAYSASVTASGGTLPYTWSASGTLPAGLSLSSAGVISGTPTAVGPSTFTVKVTDSEPTPASATANLTLTINPQKLAVTTTSLPAGQVGVAYTAPQLAATGGVTPYTWSIDPSGPPLPTGISLGADGTLSGTPTLASSSSPTFVVTDSESPVQTASAALQLTINPASTNLTDSRYAFVFSGNGPNGAVALDGTFVVSQGAVVSGTFDENAVGASLITANISGGTVTAGNGLGQLQLTLVGAPNGASATFHFALPEKGSDIRLIEFDDVDGKGTRGSGVMKVAATQPSATLSGNFAFSLSGSDAAVANAPASIIGAIQTDGRGHIVGGNSYQCLAGTPSSALSNITGTYAIDTQNYRGQLALDLGGTTFNYSFYQVSPTELFMISVDNGSSRVLAAGSLLQQQGAPFNSAFLTGTDVLELSGLTQTTGSTQADVTLGLIAFDGKGGATITNDEYNGKLVPPQSHSGASYIAADGSTGWVKVNDASGTRLYNLYLIDNKRAFVLAGDKSAASGVLEAQTGGPFTNQSFAGNYYGGSIALPGPAANNAVSVVSPNDGFLSVISDISGPAGLKPAQTLAGTYSVDATGRAIITAADGVSRIFYVVSPEKVVLLSGDGGGYLGSFEQ